MNKIIIKTDLKHIILNEPIEKIKLVEGNFKFENLINKTKQNTDFFYIIFFTKSHKFKINYNMYDGCMYKKQLQMANDDYSKLVATIDNSHDNELILYGDVEKLYYKRKICQNLINSISEFVKNIRKSIFSKNSTINK